METFFTNNYSEKEANDNTEEVYKKKQSARESRTTDRHLSQSVLSLPVA